MMSFVREKKWMSDGLSVVRGGPDNASEVCAKWRDHQMSQKFHLRSEQAIRQLDGSWTFVEQDEGLAQGCPLSPPFSCLVLAEVLAEIYDGVTLRAQTRLAAGDPGDDARSRSQRCQMHAPTKLPFRCTERSPANSR